MICILLFIVILFRPRRLPQYQCLLHFFIRDMYELALWSHADHPTPAAKTETEDDLEQRNLLLYIDKKQRELEQQLLAIDKSVSGLFA